MDTIMRLIILLVSIFQLHYQNSHAKTEKSNILTRASLFLDLPETLKEERDTELTRIDETIYADYGFVAADLQCKMYDGMWEECVQNGCFYCCSDELCHASNNSAPDCLSTSCPCENVCDCTARQCYAIADGQTCSTKEACSLSGEIPCARKGEFYVQRGVLCKSETSKEETCTFDKPLIALNLGGGIFTDHLGIVYSNCTDAKRLALFKMRWHKYFHPSVINGFPEDSLLYQESWWLCCGPVDGNYSQSCETWKVTIPSDGWYEFVVKSAECCHKRRQFDILLNGVIILSEFGPMQYVEMMEKIDVVTQFRVSGSVSKMSVEGYPTSDIKSRTIAVSFCCGRYCDRTYSYPHVSAFYVRKFQKATVRKGPSGRSIKAKMYVKDKPDEMKQNKIREEKHTKPTKKIDLSRRKWL